MLQQTPLPSLDFHQGKPRYVYFAGSCKDNAVDPIEGDLKRQHTVVLGCVGLRIEITQISALVKRD